MVVVVGQQRFALTACGSVTVCKIALEERTRRSATIMPLLLRTACSPACAGRCLSINFVFERLSFLFAHLTLRRTLDTKTTTILPSDEGSGDIEENIPTPAF